MPDVEQDSWRFYWRKVKRHPLYLRTNAGVRVVRQALPELWRRTTSGQRALPSALIVGAGKAGTTQLYSYLLEHPRCFGGRSKEIHYFSHYYDRPFSWYQTQFPLSRRVAKVRGLCIDASPSYLSSSDALRRMREKLPAAKVIVLLRDPVARAFSSYQHEKTRHRETRPFIEVVEEAIAADPDAVEFSGQLRADGRRSPNYVARGYYAMQIEALWREYPREQVLIVDSSELFADTNAVCQRVFDFLNVERFAVQTGKIYNRGHYREVIDPAAAALLRDHYAPHDARLAELLGKRLSWMLCGQRERAA